MGRHRTPDELPVQGRRGRKATRVKPPVRRRRIRTPLMALLAVAVAAGITIPALANANRDQVESVDTKPVPQEPTPTTASPDLLAAVQRDLDLTPDEAKIRIRDEAVAARSLPLMRGLTGEAYGGAWFDPAARKLIVGVTEAGVTNAALIEAVRTAGADIRPVANSLAALDAVKAKIDGMAQGGAPAAVVGWYVEPSTNSVVVEVDSRERNAETEEFLDRVRADGAAVRVSWTTRTPRTLADVVGGDRFSLVFGAQRGGCSIGFSAIGASSTAAHFITAGHCIRAGGLVLDLAGRRFGKVSVTTFDASGDYGLVDVTDLNSKLTPLINKFDGSTVRVSGSQEAPIGSSVCRSGAATGFRCGEVTAVDQTVNYAGGAIVQGLTRTTACAEPGDSGGPFISGADAQGITSGGSGDCAVGGITFFQPVNEILGALGVTLVTQ